MAFAVAVVGLGAMGSMAALELARRGHRVVGFDRFAPPHELGSSHGKTRIIREAYFEHPQYVPLVQRAYERWDDLGRWSGASLLRPTGGLMIGRPDGELVGGARRSAIEHGLHYEELSAAEVRRRFPMFRLTQNEVGLFEPRAGVLFPEVAVSSALRLAAGAGADLHYGEPVQDWNADGHGGGALAVRTAAGTYPVDRVVLAAGAWMAGDLPGGAGKGSRIRLPLTVSRQALFWFERGPGRPGGPDFGPACMPIFIWEWERGRMLYGFPDLGDGVKVAIHHEGEPTDPSRERRPAELSEAGPLSAVLASRIPDLGPAREAAVCLYTNTPSGDFLIDRHPAEPRVILASPCSGHGFKFAPVIAEVIADLVEEKASRFDLNPFRLERLIGSD